MIKRNVTETIREYDQNGKLIRESTTHTIEEDNNTSTITYPTYPRRTRRFVPGHCSPFYVYPHEIHGHR